MLGYQSFKQTALWMLREREGFLDAKKKKKEKTPS
jgi:hypothetical protein